VRAYEPLDRQVKVAWSEIHTPHPERYPIANLNEAGHDQSEIAQVMNRHLSTISCDLRRNRGQRDYRPKQAHELLQIRMRAGENDPRVAAET
jgi:IS30 family transposase